LRHPNRLLTAVVYGCFGLLCLAIMTAMPVMSWELAAFAGMGVVLIWGALLQLVEWWQRWRADVYTNRQNSSQEAILAKVTLDTVRALGMLNSEQVQLARSTGMGTIVYKANTNGPREFIDITCDGKKPEYGQVPLDFFEEYLERIQKSGDLWLLPPVADSIGWHDGNLASDGKMKRLHAANIRDAAQYMNLVDYRYQNERARCYNIERFLKAFLRPDTAEEWLKAFEVTPQ